MDATLIIIVAIFLVLFSEWFRRKRKNYIPGPIGLPFVGYIPFLTSKPYIKLTQLAKIYGPVYSLQLGSRHVVILAGFKQIKEAFERDDFIGRPPDLPFELYPETIRTNAFLGIPWKEQRRFVLHSLRKVGFGKTRMEELMKEEILELLDLVSDKVGKSIVISELLASSMSNNIASLLFGKRMSHDNPKRQRLNALWRDIAKLAGAVSWHLYFPWIRAFMKYFKLGTYGLLVKSLEEVKAYIRSEIQEHDATLDPNNVRDFMDGYLIEVNKQARNPDSTFKREVLTDLSRAFFGAGTETVKIPVDWMLLICANYPDVQKKIQSEIDQVLGRDRFPTGEDRVRMPYTEAALCEMMRWKSTLPLNIMRRTIKDTKLDGYFIPKQTYVLAVFWSVDHDKTLWGEDVSLFKPERFLSADGQKVIKPEFAIPFSIGKRTCPGKILAEVEVFLYLTSILQKYDIRLPPGKQADFEGTLGIGLQLNKQELCFYKRE